MLPVAREAVVQLARIQAFFWQRTEQRAPWVRPFLTEQRLSYDAKLYPAAMPGFVRWARERGVFNAHGVATMQLFAHNVVACYRAWAPTASGGGFFGTVTHADYRGDNIMVRRPDGAGGSRAVTFVTVRARNSTINSSSRW